MSFVLLVNSISKSIHLNPINWPLIFLRKIIGLLVYDLKDQMSRSTTTFDHL